MSEKELTEDQKRRIEELREEICKRAEQIPELLGPYTRLDGGKMRAPYRELLDEYLERMHKIAEEG